jgi:uncharacterized membrane protein
LIVKLISTFVAGALDLWVGIPTGFVLGLPAALVWAAAVAGNLSVVAVAFLAGDRLRPWVFRNRWLSRRRKRVERFWEKYGVAGVALQAPLLTGTPTAAVVALALGAPLRSLLFWMVLSVLGWGAVLTGAVSLGVSLFWG